MNVKSILMKITILTSCFAGLALVPGTAQNTTTGGPLPKPRPIRQGPSNLRLPNQNCYFPPCSPETEFPLRGSVGKLSPGTSMSIVDADGKTITTAPVLANGDFTLQAPANAAPVKHPVKICILRPSMPLTCGPAGVAAPVIEMANQHTQGQPVRIPITIKSSSGTSTGGK